ncbi:hypothetical protein D3C81_1372750 [compost metagenome]
MLRPRAHGPLPNGLPKTGSLHAAHRHARYRLSQGLYRAPLRHRPCRPGARSRSPAHRRHQHAAFRAPARRRRRRAAGAVRRRTRTGRRQPGREARGQRHPGRRHADHPRAARAGLARDHHRVPARGQYHAVGPVRVQRQLLHPVRGRGLPPHHLLPRPPGRDGDLPRHAARQSRRLPGAAVQRQPGQPAGPARRPP